MTIRRTTAIGVNVETQLTATRRTTAIGVNVETVLPTSIDSSFIQSVDSGTIPFTVDFTYTGSPAASWAWDFGDGNTSTLQNPTHTYTAAADITVTLIATNAAGSDTATSSITSNAPTDSQFIEIAIADYIIAQLAAATTLVEIKAFVRGLLFKPVQHDAYPLVEVMVSAEDEDTLYSGGVYEQTLRGMINVSIQSNDAPDRIEIIGRVATLPTFETINKYITYIMSELLRIEHHDLGGLTTTLSLGDVVITDVVKEFHMDSSRAYNIDQLRENDFENSGTIPFWVKTERTIA